jgi:hypothetical protein
VRRDQEAGEAEQDGDGERRTGVTAEGNPSRDRCSDERDASDADEDTETAKEDVLTVVLNYGCPGRALRGRKPVDRVAENAEYLAQVSPRCASSTTPSPPLSPAALSLRLT